MAQREPAPPHRPRQVSRAMMRYYRGKGWPPGADPEITALAHSALTFNAPMSDTRVAELASSVQPLAGTRVVDLGCGWAELLLRFLELAPTASGAGRDTQQAAIKRGRATAAARGLQDRVRLEVGDAAQWPGGVADVLLCVGSSYAWAGTEAALRALRPMLAPGGRLLFGEGFWAREPGPEALAALGAAPADLGSLADLTDLAVRCGYRVLALSVASAGEWDAYESGWCRGLEQWLRDNPGSARAGRVRAAADEHRRHWLRGRRGTLGFGYLTLVAG